jgi:4-hydroxybenzoate polyprenyltransferase
LTLRKERRSVDVLMGIVKLCHPLPVLLHGLAVALFVFLASWPHFIWSTICLVIGAHVLMQMAIAILNDYCDRHLDALSKRDKPIVLGRVRPVEALLLGIGCIVVMFILLLFLPPLALVISLVYLMLGMAYNLGLKATPLSGIVFALAIPLIPVYAVVGVGQSWPFLFWIIPVGALLGVALNLANSLPDIEDDARHGARTLAVVLGRRGTLLLCPLLLLGAMLLVVSLTLVQLVPAQGIILGAAVVLFGLLVCSLLSFLWKEPSSQLYRRYFLLVVGSCLVLIVGWLTSILHF